MAASAADVSEQTAEPFGLPPELARGPSVEVWAPTATLLPSLDDDTPAVLAAGEKSAT